MKVYHFIFLLCISLIQFSVKAQLTESFKVFLITCDEGDAIYEQFGHTALRIKDPSQDLDVIFNWGIFQYTENFELDFAKGKMDYIMAFQSPSDFIGQYDRQQRGVRELELNMTISQKEKFWLALQNNAKKENRGYRYDFFYYNCATIIREHFTAAMGKDLIWGKHVEADQFTFRQIIDVGYEDLAWEKFGIDLVLGSPIDVIVDNKNLMFHPLKMEEIFKDSKVVINGVEESFVISETELVKGIQRSNEYMGFFSPVLIAILILIITIVLGFFKWELGLRIWGGILFFVFGILGVLLMVMWTSTDHQTAQYNWNLLWAHPLLLVLLVSMIWKKLHLKFEKVYLVLAMLMFAMILFFLMLPQEFHTATRVLIMALAFEYYFLHKQVGRMLKVKEK